MEMLRYCSFMTELWLILKEPSSETSSMITFDQQTTP